MFVDIHNHILPDVDDGPNNWGETILLAQQAVESGIRDVVATPHHKHKHGDQFYENKPELIRALVEQTNKLLQENHIDVTVYPGIEFHIHQEILDDFKWNRNSFLTLNDTQYMLMEPPAHYYPEQTEEIFSLLINHGMIPVLAHPERNRILRKEPERIYQLVELGARIQVTASSIIGSGLRLKNFVSHLLESNLVHFIASDAHHFMKRKFNLSTAYQFIGSNYSDELKEYFVQNARSLLMGDHIDIEKPVPIGKRRQYFFLYNHPLNKK